MRLSHFIYAIAAMTIGSFAWSNEPPKAQQPLKQRVPAKLLREAMAIQDAQVKAAEVSPGPQLDELQRLADRLRKNGDAEGADLLQRFLHDHQRLAKQSAMPRKLAEDGLCIHVEVFDVQSAGVTHNRILAENHISNPANSTEVRHELVRLVSASQAKVLVQPVSLLTTMNHSGRYTSGGEFPIPKNEDGKTVVEYREFGISISALPTQLSKDQIRLQLMCDVIERDEKNPITVLGTRIPNLIKRKVDSTVYSNLNEVTVHSYAQGTDAGRLFVLTKVEPHN